MTTPVEKMGLEDTVSNIYAIRQAISSHSQEMNSDKYYEGTRETRQAMRAKTEELANRRDKLEGSITRSVTGPKGAYRETLIKGKEMIDLGPYKGFSAHFGPVGTKAKKFTNRDDLFK